MENKEKHKLPLRLRMFVPLARFVYSSPIGPWLTKFNHRILGIPKDLERKPFMKSSDEREREKAIQVLQLQFFDLCFLATMAACMIWVMYSFNLDLEQGAANMFPRSGAVLVATALLAEFGSLRLEKYDGEDEYIARGLAFHRKMIKVVVLFYVFLGTMIWAYGDLYINWDISQG